MIKLTHLALATGLLAGAALANAASAHHTNHFDKQWSVGVQGGIGAAFVNNSSTFEYFQESVVENNQPNHLSGSAQAGFYGLNIAHNWMRGNHIWSLNLAFNQGTGSVEEGFHVSESAADIDEFYASEKTKIDQQYNLMLQWKEAITHDTYLVLGAGVSALKTVNMMTAGEHDLDEDNYELNSKHSSTQFGAGLSFGVEHFVTEHSAFDMSVNYFTYGSKGIKNTVNFGINDNDSGDSECFTHRSTKASLLTFTAGYSMYF